MRTLLIALVVLHAAFAHAVQRNWKTPEGTTGMSDVMQGGHYKTRKWKGDINRVNDLFMTKTVGNKERFFLQELSVRPEEGSRVVLSRKQLRSGRVKTVVKIGELGLTRTIDPDHPGKLVFADPGARDAKYAARDLAATLEHYKRSITYENNPGGKKLSVRLHPKMSEGEIAAIIKLMK